MTAPGQPESATGIPKSPAALLRRRGQWQRTLKGLIGRGVEREVFRIVGGPVFFAIAHAACRLDLIGLLRRKPGLTVEEIRQELKLQDDPTRILLLGCIALRLVRKRGERHFVGRSLTARSFDPNDRNTIRPFLEWMQQIVAPSMRYFDEAMIEGTAAGLKAFPGDDDNLYGRIARDSELQAVFYGAMNARTKPMNPLFLDCVDFSSFRRILDVAGGDGEIMLEIARRYPHLDGTVLEIPTVAEQAAARFAQEGFSNRMHGVACDILNEDFPTGFDGVLLCHVNGNHSQETNRMLYRKAFAALSPGGIVCLYSAFMDDDGSGPFSSAVASAYFYCTVSGKGRQYSWAESAAWIREAGFQDLTQYVLMMNHGVILGRKP